MPASSEGNVGITVLGVDTSLRSTGVAVVKAVGSSLRAVEYGVLRNPATRPLSGCLKHLMDGVGDLIERHAPEAVAVEGAFFHKNARTAMILGQARGAAIAACAAHGVPVFEYAPRRVKQAVVGYGGAGKEQVKRTVMGMISLASEPTDDESDALAIAICHLHTRTGHRALMPEPI